jgi:hypothetical protein
MEPLLWSSFLSPNGTLVPVVDFANSVIIGTQIYGRLRNWMPTATDTISFGTDWKEVFHSVARWSSYTIYVPVIGVKSKLTECV